MKEEVYQYPKKQMASGAIIYDSYGKILIVKPSYKNCWHLPGGVIEEFESPYSACVREVKEETNLSIVPKKLKAINHLGIESEKVDALVFIFDCGSICQYEKESIRVPAQEIEEYRFIDNREIAQYLDVRMAEIIQNCLNSGNQNTLYMENMEVVL
jgi:8-oxo-dGTP diphosphatase